MLTGGELPALVAYRRGRPADPGALHDGESMLTDSFQDGLLDAPSFTRPPEFRGMRVPDVLLSGNHEEIAAWRMEQRRRRTGERRTDLMEQQ